MSADEQDTAKKTRARASLDALKASREKAHEAAAEAHRRELLERVDRVQPVIVEMVRGGNYPPVAAMAAGVPPRTWDAWQRRAKDGDERFVELFEAIGAALAYAETELVKRLMTPPLDPTGKADSGWIRAVQFLLERTRRERWGEKVEMRVRVEDSIAEMMDELEARMSPQAFDELTRAIVEIGGMSGGALGG